MASATPPALLVDLEAETVRFLLRSRLRGEAQIADPAPPVLERAVSFFTEEPPLANAICWALDEFGVRARTVDIFISAAAPVADDDIYMPKPSRWSFRREALAAALKSRRRTARRIEVVNDMFAFSLSLPDMMRTPSLFERIENGPTRAMEGFPMLALCARPNLGATGLAPVPYGPTASEKIEPVWVPVLSEPGGMSLWPASSPLCAPALSKRLAKIAKDLPLSAEGLWTAHDFLAPGGIRHALRVCAPGALDSDAAIAEIGGVPLRPGAADVMEAWSFLFGLWVRSLALAFGARGGIYIAGITPRLFLMNDERGEHNRKTFLDAFQIGGTRRDYLPTIPIRLIRHENPFLMGLTRLEAAQN